MPGLSHDYLATEELLDGTDGETYSFPSEEACESWFYGYGAGLENKVRRIRFEFPGQHVGYVDIAPVEEDDLMGLHHGRNY